MNISYWKTGIWAFSHLIINNRQCGCKTQKTQITPPLTWWLNRTNSMTFHKTIWDRRVNKFKWILLLLKPPVFTILARWCHTLTQFLSACFFFFIYNNTKLTVAVCMCDSRRQNENTLNCAENAINFNFMRTNRSNLHINWRWLLCNANAHAKFCG